MPDELSVEDEVRAVIGAAVTSLLESGQSINRDNLIALLQIRSKLSTDIRHKAICLDASRLLQNLIH